MTVNAAPVPTVTPAAAAATAVSGTAKSFAVADLFTFGGGSVAADYDLAVSPTYAGVTGTGPIQVATSAAPGTAHVVATHKTASGVTATKDIVISAPPLTSFTLTGAPALGGTAVAPTAAITGTATVVVTVAPNAGATLGTVSVTSSDTSKATAVVGSGANANKVTITGVAAGTTDVEISVAGVTAKQTIAVTVT